MIDRNQIRSRRKENILRIQEGITFVLDHWKFLLSFTVMFALLVFAYQRISRKPLYQADTEVYISHETEASDSSLSSGNDPAVLAYAASGYTVSAYAASGYAASAYTASDYTAPAYTASGYIASETTGYDPEVFKSSAVLKQIIRRLELPINDSELSSCINISVTGSDAADFVRIEVNYEDAQTAVRIAETAAEYGIEELSRSVLKEKPILIRRAAGAKAVLFTNSGIHILFLGSLTGFFYACLLLLIRMYLQTRLSAAEERESCIPFFTESSALKKESAVKL